MQGQERKILERNISENMHQQHLEIYKNNNTFTKSSIIECLITRFTVTLIAR
jgi:hypothetical protein